MNNSFGLYLILTDPVAGYEACTEAAVAENIRYLQLRMKNAARSDMVDMGKRLKSITSGTATRLIINDDLESAMDCDADGIHLGQNDLNLTEARKRWAKKGKIFGLSTHSRNQAFQALEQKPDYIGIGPVFPTSTKSDTAPVVGITEAGRIAAEVPLTAAVIGGIHSGNLDIVLQAGATNYCVVSAVNSSTNPRSAIRELQTIWKNRIN
ncbi:thiamine phosphate synthase [Pontiella agarivorans]|uniref:Thiamine-phosphate synthase n=1 Tax=Pontiella agarivorans TaxID=3038953 RepID=A0ABU5MZP8_9BACT|nr:thiamine phosphate synthase [Pontiella agarivorans]MDZ8119566.1 thiamine phosphate synthase [Pontiella agarivorans]